MTRTPEQQKQHDEDTIRCIEKLRDIGRTYGKVIMRAVLAAEDPDQIDYGVEAAVADVREFLRANGIDDSDVETSVNIVRRAIIAEGKAIAFMLPDHVGGIH